MNNKQKISFFLLTLCLCFSFCSVSVFADETDDSSTPNNLVSVSSDSTVQSVTVVDINQLIEQLTPQQLEQLEDTEIKYNEPILVTATQTRQTVTTNDTNGFKAVILSLIGDYETVVTDYTYQQNNYQFLSHSIQIERDWAWIISAGIFTVMLYCTMKAIGGCIARF